MNHATIVAVTSLQICVTMIHAYKETQGSNAGHRFVVFPGPGYKKAEKGFGKFTLIVAPYDITGAQVKVRCPLCRGNVFKSVSQYVEFGDDLIIHVPESFSKTKTGVYGGSLLITSTHLISIQVLAHQGINLRDSYMALPVKALDNKYVVNNHEINGFLAVVAASPHQTRVILKYKDSNMSVTCKDEAGQKIAPGWELAKHLKQYQVFLLFCDYLTGSFLYASKPVAVVMGNYPVLVLPKTTKAHKTKEKNKGVLQEQALPMTACSTRFIFPGRVSQEVATPFVKVVACYKNVKVTFKRRETILQDIGDVYESGPDGGPTYVECTVGCLVTMIVPSRRAGQDGGPTMVQLVPIANFGTFYTTRVMPQDLASPFEKTMLIVVYMTVASKSLFYNDSSFLSAGGQVQLVEGGRTWRVWYYQIQQSANILYDDKDVPFGVYLYHINKEESSDLSSGGMQLTNLECWTTLMEPDDLLDNDCDDNADEEIENGHDDDFDGRVDEDIGTAPLTLRHGKWSPWSKWLCGVRCPGHDMFRRFRQCSHPSPIGEGRQCEGPDAELSSKVCERLSNVCLEDCPATNWGDKCDQPCSSGCLRGLCERKTGYCLGCPSGMTGEFCSFECPRYRFGTNCSQDCSNYCKSSDCHPVTGVCVDHMKILPFILRCLSFTIIPATLIIALACWCSNRDPDREQIRRAIKDIDFQISRVKIVMQARRLEMREMRRRSRFPQTKRNAEDNYGMDNSLLENSDEQDLQKEA